MPKSPPEQNHGTYLRWSREPAVGLFAVLPLWLCYEGLRLSLAPYERNGAEVLISEALRLLGPAAFDVLRVMFAALVIFAAMHILRRRVPWLRVTLVTALEGLVYALMLGPLAGGFVAASSRVLQAGEAPASSQVLVTNLVGSLGAGIFEELVFRLALLSVLALLLMRVATAFGMPRALGAAAAVLLSALLFSLFHHVGPGAAAYSRREFAFRTAAGLVLGVMFVLRGFGVCVYAHAFYDVHYYLTVD